MDNKLINSLISIGKPIETLVTPEGSELLLLTSGGRILGLFPRGSEHNFLWTNPDLQSERTARGVFEGDGWHNTGGDRTWLTPELDIFFPKYPDTSLHWEPPQLDAEDYILIEDGKRIGMTKSMTIALARPRQSVQLHLSKFISPAPNPLRYERGISLGAFEYAGYTLETSLEVLETGGQADFQMGIWNLLQLPHGGDLLVPTYSKTYPKIIFGEVAPENLVVSDRLLTFKVRFAGEHKIGVRATATTGRAGYLYRTGDEWAFVARNFNVNPSGEYVDVPASDPEDLGYSFQGVNVNSSLGAFCELEYHAPAINCGAGSARSEDVSQVWAFRGSRKAIETVMGNLIGHLVDHNV